MLTQPVPSRHLFSGILFISLLAISSLYLANIRFIAQLGFSPLIIAILLGIVYGNTLHHRFSRQWLPGIQFAAKNLLRIGIIFYGFRITYQEMAAIGLNGFIIDTFIVVSTLSLGTIIGIKFFELDRHTALLISAGSAICGAAAVIAVEDVLKSEPYKASAAIGTVVVFGTTAMFLYPFLQQINFFHLTEQQFALFTGASIHEVAQALAAGNNISAQAGNVAVVVKMMRVLLLVPVLFILSFWEKRTVKQDKLDKKNWLQSMPWFAVLFLVCISIHSLQIIPTPIVNIINQLDLFLLTMAMAAIGVGTHFKKLVKVGIKPLYLAVVLFAWLMGSAYMVVQYCL